MRHLACIMKSGIFWTLILLVTGYSSYSQKAASFRDRAGKAVDVLRSMGNNSLADEIQKATIGQRGASVKAKAAVQPNAVVQSALPAPSQQEYNALWAIYNATGGNNWINRTGWQDARPDSLQSVEGWFGVEIDSSGHVTGLYLNSNNLVGQVPSAIGDLTYLGGLYLYMNSLTGTIPREIGNLTNLRVMLLFNNQFSGAFPDEFGHGRLIFVWISENQFSGAMPQSFGTQDSLYFLWADHNNFSGPLPASLGASPTFAGLEAHFNQLSGGLPAALATNVNTRNVFVSNNRLDGYIPVFDHPGSLRADNNRLTFEDFLDTKRNSPFSIFTYSPQDSVDVKKDIPVQVGQPVTLSASVDLNTTPASYFLWFKYVDGVNDVWLADSTAVDGRTYTIPSVSQADIGAKYYYRIVNPDVSDLQLTSRLQTLTLSTPTVCAATLEQEYHALMALYQSTNGPEWNNNFGWKDADPNVVQSPNGWRGVVLDSQGHVVELNLYNNGLSGPLPSEIGNLCRLTKLNLYNNAISSLPPSIGNLAELKTLSLNFNSLTGSVPTEVFGLIKLTNLGLSNNQFSGTLSPSIANLTKLEILYLNHNQFSGTIPPALGTLIELRQLTLNANQFTGSIPPELGNLTKLIYLWMPENQLTGEIPPELGNIDSLIYLDLAVNKLSGPIPSQLSDLKKLVTLHVFDNQLSGKIPDQVAGMTRLKDFNFSYNEFTFTDFLKAKDLFQGPAVKFVYFPQDTVDVVKVVNASIGGSATFTSFIDRSTNPPSKYQWFKYIDGINDIPMADSASVNGFAFTIPSVSASDIGTHYYYKISNTKGSSLTLISELQTLALDSVGGCQSTLAEEYQALMALYLATNGAEWTNNNGWRDANPNVVQSVAGWYGVLTDATGHVTAIDLDGIADFSYSTSPEGYQIYPGNNLVGTIPEEITNLSKLVIFNVGGNHLTGRLPESIGQMCELQWLIIARNQISGPIPPSLGNCVKLTRLFLEYNQLNDSIPSSLGALTNLWAVQFNNNNFTGRLPASLGNLNSLVYFHAFHNQLSGSIPPQLGNLPRLAHFEVNNNQLTGPIPQQLGNIKTLTYVHMGDNQFTGTIPATFTSINNLEYLNVAHNLLSEVLPPSLLNNPRLDSLRIEDNRFTFSDFLSVKQQFVNTVVLYAPQDSVDVRKDIEGVTGVRLTLTTSIDRSTQPLSKYQWFKFVDGVNDVAASSVSANNHTIVLQNPQMTDDGARYYYKITNDSAASLVLVSRLQTLRLSPCTISTAPGFTAKRYLCALNFIPFTGANRCKALGYFWNFGDGTTSAVKSPVHAFNTPGSYDVSLRLSVNCGSCTKDTTVTRTVQYNPADEILKDSTIYVSTDVKLQVLSVSVSTFSDAWPLQYSSNLLSKNSFLNGSEGVWRNDAAYVYDVERSQSPDVRIAQDGSFSLEQFNWQFSDLNAIPHWTNANTMTQYSPFSYELENKDVLGIYSSALYDYGGHLPSANGVNMRNQEMAFTSFEFLDGNVTGNWIFGTEASPEQTVYKIQSAKNYMAIVETTTENLAGVEVVDVAVRGFGFGGKKSRKLIQRVHIACTQQHPQNPNWTIVVFDRAPFAMTWSGQMIISNEVTPSVTPTFDHTIAHSGESSLKITATQTFPQELLKPESGKSYWFSGWVSINNSSVLTPTFGNGISVEIILKNSEDQVISTTLIEPSGRIIEGWQQIKGRFTSTIADGRIELRFKSGSAGTVWFDDLRFHPEKGSMKSYVYNLNDYRLQAILDEENFASFFYYDKEGNLYLTKKETEEGIKTLTENVSYQIESSGN